MATSYANAGGTGNRTGSITASNSASLFAAGVINNLINGNTSEFTTWFTTFATSPYMKFGFATAKIIDEFTWHQNGTNNHGVWKWQACNDDASYADIGSTFTLGGATGANVHTEPAGNTTAFLWYKMVLVSGNTDGGPFLNEIEFKIDDPPTVITGTLATTEASDVAALVGNAAAYGSLAATEAPDVVLISSSPIVTGTLDATESPDVFKFSESHHTAVLAAIEAPDVVEIVGKALKHPYPVVLILNN